MTRHLDLDGLADLLVGEAPADSAEHARTCPRCSQALAELEQAQEPVRAALAALPDPEVPADLPARLDAALLRAREAEERLRRRPARSRAGARLLAVAACAVAVVGLGVAGLSALVAQVSDRGGADSTTSASSASSAAAGAAPQAEPAPARTPAPAWATGTDYAAGTSAVAAALAGLLARPAPAAPPARTAPTAAVSSPAAGPDALARLHDTAELEGCLRALAGGAAPLALDYATFRGAPALVVVLPAPVPGQVDVEVVAAACDDADAHLLLTARLPRPA